MVIDLVFQCTCGLGQAGHEHQAVDVIRNEGSSVEAFASAIGTVCYATLDPVSGHELVQLIDARLDEVLAYSSDIAARGLMAVISWSGDEWIRYLLGRLQRWPADHLSLALLAARDRLRHLQPRERAVIPGLQVLRLAIRELDGRLALDLTEEAEYVHADLMELIAVLTSNEAESLDAVRRLYDAYAKDHAHGGPNIIEAGVITGMKFLLQDWPTATQVIERLPHGPYLLEMARKTREPGPANRI